MQYAPCTASAPTAPGPSRERRLAQVKFVALVIEPEAAPAETVSSPPAGLYRGLLAFLSRVRERLVAARP